MITKAIIIGASTTGKTTLLNHLKEILHTPVYEADDILSEMNGGTYPHDSNYKMNTLAPQMVDNILGREEVVFFTNTDYFKPKDLETAHRRGFKVFQLSIPREQMEMRNKHRVEHEGYDDLSRYFDTMMSYQKGIKDKGLVDWEINADRPSAEIADELLQQLVK